MPNTDRNRGPDDPEEITAEGRADRAEAACNAEGYEIPRDLMADLMHLMDRSGLDVRFEIEAAYSHYTEER